MRKIYVVREDEDLKLMEWLWRNGIDFEWICIHPNLEWLWSIASKIPILQLRDMAYDLILRINYFIMKGKVIYKIKLEEK
jgi:hypothetical protein